MTDWNPFDHHRGPYVLQVSRPAPKRKYPVTMETLRGTVHGSEVEEEAKALLADPRDTITAVFVWSVPEQQHIVTYRRQPGA